MESEQNTPTTKLEAIPCSQSDSIWRHNKSSLKSWLQRVAPPWPKSDDVLDLEKVNGDYWRRE